jgi:putative transposase
MARLRRAPRDRNGSFEPRLIGKHERRFTEFDKEVSALYAPRLTVREIQAFLKKCMRSTSRRI